jgi:hypothetical protein
MNRKNEKGFTLVLALVLLLVMSLMGGALIVISSSDHQSNNSSDQYQQAFYVAETGLIQAEKSIIKQYMGEFFDPAEEAENLKAAYDTAQTDDDLTDEQKAEFATAYEDFVGTAKFEDEYGPGSNPSGDFIAGYAATLQGTTTTLEGEATTLARDRKSRGMPRNITAPLETDCKRSFKNITDPYIEEDRALLVTEHVLNQSFWKIIEPIFEDYGTAVDNVTYSKDKADIKENEKDFLERYRYEFFSVNVGSAEYLGTGSSIRKGSTDIQTMGTAYKIYACGILVEVGANEENPTPQLLIPLESLIVLPN